MAAPTDDLILDVEGMTCASCVARVERSLRKVEGASASVNLATESARVTVPAGTDPDALVAAVRAVGYEARVRAPQTAAPAAHEAGGHVHDVADRPGTASLRPRLIVSAILAAVDRAG